MSAAICVVRKNTELKVGTEGQITPRLNVWGNVAQQVGDQWL